MSPFPAPCSVLLLDNARIHQKIQIDALCAAHGVLVLYLPPYSPDYQPIECLFNCTLRQMQSLYGVGQHAVPLNLRVRASFFSAMTPQQACNTFARCGINVTAADRAWAM